MPNHPCGGERRDEADGLRADRVCGVDGNIGVEVEVEDVVLVKGEGRG